MTLPTWSALFAAVFVLPICGTEIESKDGRSFEGAILDADASSVKVKRKDTGKTFSLQRENLSIETNNFINGFLKEKRDAAEAAKGKRTTFSEGSTKLVVGSKPEVSKWEPKRPAGDGTPGKHANHVGKVRLLFLRDMTAIVKLLPYLAAIMILASCTDPNSTLAVGGPVDFEGPPAMRATPASRGVDPIGPPANKLLLGSPHH